MLRTKRTCPRKFRRDTDRLSCKDSHRCTSVRSCRSMRVRRRKRRTTATRIVLNVQEFKTNVLGIGCPDSIQSFDSTPNLLCKSRSVACKICRLDTRMEGKNTLCPSKSQPHSYKCHCYHFPCHCRISRRC